MGIPEQGCSWDQFFPIFQGTYARNYILNQDTLQDALSLANKVRPDFLDTFIFSGDATLESDQLSLRHYQIFDSFIRQHIVSRRRTVPQMDMIVERPSVDTQPSEPIETHLDVMKQSILDYVNSLTPGATSPILEIIKENVSPVKSTSTLNNDGLELIELDIDSLDKHVIEKLYDFCQSEPKKQRLNPDGVSVHEQVQKLEKAIK
ncbi:hypothetical protein EDD86DRAFT_208046 [Gorgonomyces haynaldii]|nr:hypothetical protein EDD86DRAFT_208046 [Gorgonomyces haynaldii]